MIRKSVIQRNINTSEIHHVIGHHGSVFLKLFFKYLLILVVLMLVFWSDYWWMSIFVSPLLIGAAVVAGLSLLAGKTWQSLIGGILFGGLFFGCSRLASRFQLIS